MVGAYLWRHMFPLVQATGSTLDHQVGNENEHLSLPRIPARPALAVALGGDCGAQFFLGTFGMGGALRVGSDIIDIDS